MASEASEGDLTQGTLHLWWQELQGHIPPRNPARDLGVLQGQESFPLWRPQCVMCDGEAELREELRVLQCVAFSPSFLERPRRYQCA